MIGTTEHPSPSFEGLLDGKKELNYDQQPRKADIRSV